VEKQLQATVCLSAQKSSQSGLRGVSSNQIGAKTLAVTGAAVVKTDGIDIDGYLYHFCLLDQSLFGNHLIGSFTCCCSAVAETLVMQSCCSTDRERCQFLCFFFGISMKHGASSLLSVSPIQKGILIFIFNTDLYVNGYKFSLPTVKSHSQAAHAVMTCFVIDKPKKTFACFVFYKG